MRQARGATQQAQPASPLKRHEPSFQERMRLARDCMIIARVAAGTADGRALAKREVARARSEVGAIVRALEAARLRSLLLDTKADPEILKLREMSLRLSRELKSAATKISRMN